MNELMSKLTIEPGRQDVMATRLMAVLLLQINSLPSLIQDLLAGVIDSKDSLQNPLQELLTRKGNLSSINQLGTKYWVLYV